MARGTVVTVNEEDDDVWMDLCLILVSLSSDDLGSSLDVVFFYYNFFLLRRKLL